MAPFKFNFTFKTDANGEFEESREFDTREHWPWWLPEMDIDVGVQATLVEPVTTLNGAMDIDAVDGSPHNEKRSFKLEIGKKEHLGEWTIDYGRQKITVTGSTDPIIANNCLRVNVLVDRG